MNIKKINNNLAKIIYTKKTKNNNFLNKKIKSSFSKIFHKMLSEQIKQKKNNFIKNKKIKLNKIFKKNNHHHSLTYQDECIELNQEGLWVKTLVQIRKKLIHSYEEIINMQV